ncbi:MAG: hypothetical protein OEY52_04650 [Gammaproteobacteria bacterium]|nr:hypothetical protein [Gammaproteobacteria bacterium]
MRYLVYLLFFISFNTYASKPCEKLIENNFKLKNWCECDRPLTRDTELRDWCEMASKTYFTTSQSTPYNWTATYWTEQNMLHVKGEWRVDRRKVTVECQVSKGSRSRYARMKVEDSKTSKILEPKPMPHC